MTPLIPADLPPILANTAAVILMWISIDRRLSRLELLVARLCGQHPDHHHPPISQPPKPDAGDIGAV